MDPNKILEEQAKAVLKAEYEQKKIEIGETVDNTGIEAAASDASMGITTAGKLAGDVLKDGYEEIKLTVEDTVEKLGEIAKSVLWGGGNTTQGQGGGEGGSRAHDHQGGFRFRVELGGIQAGAFRAVDGLSTTVELIEYQGGGDMFARQIPGRPKIAPVVLKKGYVNTAVLWDWMQATVKGQFKFENVSVVLLDDSGTEELARYNLMHTWPSRWSGWQLDANGSNAMVEEMELQVREMERVA